MAMRTNGVEDRTIKSFEYPACPSALAEPVWDGWTEAADDSAQEQRRSGGSAWPASNTTFEEQLAEETRRAFETGRERGREEGRRLEREAMGSARAAEAERSRRQAADFVEVFAKERERYLCAIEQEVVRLALAVAARILRREAQMDPLLLSGAVRVALGQLAATSEIRIRVPVKEAELWTETIEHLPNLATKPIVVPEDNMLLGDCRIDSKVGTVDLGIRAQLGEIERGFFDRTSPFSAPGPEAPAEVRA